MKVEVRVPPVGESIKEGILAVWLKETGEMVTEGEEIFELETDKATVAVPSPADGALETLVGEGAEVTVDQQVAWLDTDVDAAALSGPGPEEPAAAGKAPETSSHLSPAAHRIVAEFGLDTAAITGTGKGGRILKMDALQAALAQPDATTTEEVTDEALPPVPGVPELPPAAATGDRQRRVPMSPLRRRTAARLLEARRNAAHLTTFNEVDMGEVVAIRTRYREAFEKEHDIRLGFMSFFVRACCLALRDYPEINAMVDGDDIVYNDFYDIGVAISIEKGLVVPVIRDADGLGFADIEKAIAALAGKAKTRRLLPDDLTGGTFTITNGGVFGSLLSTPIPAYPQTAILGMHTILERPVAVDGEVSIRPMMYLALTYDHRVVDGREAIGFLVRIKDLVQNPTMMLLGL